MPSIKPGRDRMILLWTNLSLSILDDEIVSFRKSFKRDITSLKEDIARLEKSLK